ncbi:MAG: hypothetical protein HQK83_04500 [Fibrobacteria bacterium]|nr:hypothetical protein [Fibrobacteria bacterium]
MEKLEEYYRYSRSVKLGLEVKNEQLLREALEIKIPNNMEKKPEKYAKWLSSRAMVFTKFGEYENAIAEYMKGYKYCPEQNRWEYCLNWAASHIAPICGSADGKTRIEYAKKGLAALRLSIAERYMGRYPQQVQSSISNLQAYLNVIAGDKKKALSALRVSSRTTTPHEFFETSECNVYLAHIGKGVVASIELKNGDLLKEIIINGFGLQNLNRKIIKPYEILVNMVSQNIKEILAEFEALFTMNNLNVHFPNSKKFFSYYQEQDKNKMEKYFQ